MTTSPSLEKLRNCMEGVIPSAIATVSSDGIPNITYVSQVHYVDGQHVALSFQFFNKTRENILANPYAMVQMVDPTSSAHYRLRVLYLRTETDGALFENMKAKLAGIASHTGMSKVFRLLGSDIYKVLSIEAVPGKNLTATTVDGIRLVSVRNCLQRISASNDTEGLFDNLMSGLKDFLGIQHAMLLIHDPRSRLLYTVASQGYEISGVGAEIPLGVGVIGVAAQQKTPIRIMFTTSQYAYNKTVRDNLLRSDPNIELETEIPFAGLAEPHSQIAVPICLNNELLGILYADSEEDLRFDYEDEDALLIVCEFLALSIQRLQCLPDDLHFSNEGEKEEKPASEDRVSVCHYIANHSIFINDEYLIKGVAGAILWKLLKAFNEEKRVEFSNRELRLDPDIGLPEIGDNLEARLILLQKRLHDRCEYLRIEKSGRGRFRLKVEAAVNLIEI